MKNFIVINKKKSYFDNDDEMKILSLL